MIELDTMQTSSRPRIGGC